MAHEELEKTRVYVEAAEFSDLIWDEVMKWRDFASDTVGKQFVRAADSIGANIAESYGRYHWSDKLNFLYYARGSLYECEHWPGRSVRRQLLSQEMHDAHLARLQNLAVAMNAYIKDKRKMRGVYGK